MPAREIEIEEADILCSEPAAEMRPSVRRPYRGIGHFVGEYLSFRRGARAVIDMPHDLGRGALLDVEMDIARVGPVILHAEIVASWSLGGTAQALVQFVVGRFTDRIVAGVSERGLVASIL